MVEWNGTVVLTTPRLLLRTFRRDDLPLYAALNADPEVARYLGGPLTRQDSDDIVVMAGATARWLPALRRSRHRRRNVHRVVAAGAQAGSSPS